MRKPPLRKGPRIVPNSVELYGETFYRERWVDKVFCEDYEALSADLEAVVAAAHGLVTRWKDSAGEEIRIFAEWDDLEDTLDRPGVRKVLEEKGTGQ